MSRETGLPEKIDAKAALWTADFPGQCAPVIANGKLYIMGYEGEGPDLQEGVACFDAETGKLLWKHLFNDFLSDIIYLRYATSSPDDRSGNGQRLHAGQLRGFLPRLPPTAKLLWQHSMMEEFGRMTFPNTAPPRRSSTRISSSRAASQPRGARTGRPAIASTRSTKRPANSCGRARRADRPQDNTFSHPWLSFLNGKRVLFSAGGD